MVFKLVELGLIYMLFLVYKNVFLDWYGIMF